MKRVVITGLGAITPIGNSVEEFAEGLRNGRSGSDYITHFDASKFKTTFACEVKNFDGDEIFGRKEARKMDLFSQYGVVAARQAIEDSGLDFTTEDVNRIGVVWGSGIGGLRSLEEQIEINSDYEKNPRYNPFMIPKMIADIVPGQISIEYGLRGINYGTISACASSSHAIINALDNIRIGRADVIVTGGSEAAVTRAGIGGFSGMKALSSRNDDPATASRPFDKDRDGFVLGEGGGALILEEYEHAVNRGARIYAEVLGGAMTADAYHITAPHPDGLGAANVMTYALEDARVSHDAIDYINVHGTSTPLGDVAEIKAIEKVFGEKAYEVHISSTKSMTGHLLGASGAVESIACLVAMDQGFIPPTINHFTDDPEIDDRLKLTFNDPVEAEVNYALCNTFGFGGHNTSLVLKKVTA
ncbi:beta-ketoacyl-ACP synthase II [Membranicola marinus]|uniref:3-oxoacyl-[acyl-carrier-protein] synthase 2 n=1 Tax=Membranihabitans marinus TaxID=1227546 RepID=A0A953HN64_9BACT|nr:beta-ketoacyl-ACP synthase II [Membranihabitans marinus]MBY5957608.1 beta-ketoacyl-ACP synthase II [Membranihabitans marinus]